MGQTCAEGGSQKRIPNERTIDIEDCLNMNIFTPARPPYHHTNLPEFPVLFFVHGGSFSTGSNAELPAAYMLEHNIVLVVPNYRLDALGNTGTFTFSHQSCESMFNFFVCYCLYLGFLSTQTADIPGNAGMLDILLALKWVKNNIKHFGGNPNKITVAGQSSGGVLISSLLLSPLVPSNLFQQMIIHSGSIFAPWSWSLDPIANAKDIAAHANLPENATILEINAAFMKMDVYDLLNATNEHYVCRNGHSFNGSLILILIHL